METRNIYTCLNHREFLKSCLTNHRSSQGLRALARKAGFKSPGHLTMLIKGQRRLTMRSADLLAKALALKGRKRSLFLAFSRLDSSRSEKEKNSAREEILRLKSFLPEFKISAKQYSFLAIWYYPVVYALLQNISSQSNAAFIAARLGRGVTAANVDQALQDLHFLGLIVKDKEGQWRPVHAALSTPDEVRELAVGKYHRNMLALAGESLELPLEDREFNGLTVAVPRRLLPQVKEKIRALRTELNEMLSRENQTADVYQINLQFFPMTTGMERTEQ